MVYWYQGAEVDPHKLAFTKKLMETVLGEAKACGRPFLLLLRPLLVAFLLTWKFLVRMGMQPFSYLSVCPGWPGWKLEGVGSCMSQCAGCKYCLCGAGG